MAGRIPRKRDLARSPCLRHEDLHAGDHALERPLHGPHPDLQPRILPENHVMLEEDGNGAIQPDVEDGNQLSLDAIAHPRSHAGFDVRLQKLRWCLHLITPYDPC
jgi:hypothetical protein